MADFLFCLVIGGMIVVGVPAVAVMGWAQWRDSRPEQFDGGGADA